MRFALMTEPQQGLSYDEILAVARTAEESGIEAFFRSDHYASFPGGAGLPTTDAWATLAGLARELSTIRLGVLVSPVTFRIPGNLAKVIQTVDEMSDGRVEAGFGAGWNEKEHEQLGIPFPPLGERFDLLAEQMAIIHGLWTEPDGWSFEGEHWQVKGAKRHGEIGRGGRRHPHILFGGKGGPRLARLVAAYGDEFNLNSASPEDAPAAYANVREACAKVGRDPATLRRSACLQVDLPGYENYPGHELLRSGRGRAIRGDYAEIAETLRGYADAGVSHIQLWLDPNNVEGVEQFARVLEELDKA